MKATIVSVVIALLLIVGAFTLSSGKGNSGGRVDNVTIVEGKQIIDIRAKGGYQPQRSTAKAGIPTILRFNTSNTFDCSASVRIPSMGISKLLEYSGSTDIEIDSGKVGILKGSCGMGMYPFEIEFTS